MLKTNKNTFYINVTGNKLQRSKIYRCVSLMHNYCEDYLQNEFYTGYMVLFQGMKKSETLLEIYKKRKTKILNI